MIDYGSAPAPDEVEVSVFGPGFGEAIALHVGAGAWLLIDSCLEPLSRTPASQNYLQSIGVPGENVKVIIASHWHDDHVRGIAELARFCPEAEFHLSNTFSRKEALAVLAAHSGKFTHLMNRGTRELYTVLVERKEHYFVNQRTIIFQQSSAEGSVLVTAVSPVQASFEHSIASLASWLPHGTGDEPVNNIVPLKPNIEAVAVHVDLGNDAILLGSDLEDHQQFGWTAVVANSWVRSRRKASALKVAHHGSSTGDCAAVWTTLIAGEPVAALTPFNRGVKLPTQNDIQRIKLRTRGAWISSGATMRPRVPHGQLKRLNDVAKNVTPVNNGFGCIRLRRRAGEPWRTECFGDARAL